MGVPLTAEQIPILQRAGRHLQDPAARGVGAAVPRRRRVRGRAPPADRGVRHAAGPPQRDGGQGRRPGARAASSRSAPADQVLADAGLRCGPPRRRSASTPRPCSRRPRAGRRRSTPTRAAGARHPPAAGRRADPRPRRVLRGPVLVAARSPTSAPTSSRSSRSPATRCVASSDRSSPPRPGSAPWPPTSRIPRSRPVIEALLRRADVVHHNLRPGAAERLGLDDDSVRTVNPDIVYLHAPGWGSTGPFALRQSFAPMLSGYAGVTYEVAGQFNPPAAAVGQRGSGQRPARRGRDAARAAPPRSHRCRQVGREPAAERHDGPHRAHRPHGRRRGHRRRASRSRCRSAAAPSNACTRPPTVGCASWPRPTRNSARCSRPWASRRSTTTSARVIACAPRSRRSRPRDVVAAPARRPASPRWSRWVPTCTRS